jgi:hypothetical protein
MSDPPSQVPPAFLAPCPPPPFRIFHLLSYDCLKMQDAASGISRKVAEIENLTQPSLVMGCEDAFIFMCVCVCVCVCGLREFAFICLPLSGI